MEWQAWHFLNTSRPAAASPPGGVAVALPAVGACGCGSAAAIVCMAARSSFEDGSAAGCDAFEAAAGVGTGGLEAALEGAAGTAAVIGCCGCGSAAADTAGEGAAESTAAAGAVDDD